MVPGINQPRCQATVIRYLTWSRGGKENTVFPLPDPETRDRFIHRKEKEGDVGSKAF